MRRMPLVLVCLTLLIGCYEHIDPGHVGVLIESCGSNPGVSPTPLPVGYHTTGSCTTIVQYPTFVQNVVWTHSVHEGNPVNEEITFTNADQMQIAADISLAYTLDPQKVPTFYSKFRADHLSNFTDGFLRNMAREKFDESGGRYKIEQIMGDNAGFLAEVRAALQKEIAPYGVQIVQFGFIGAPRPPQAVIDSINAKAGATQKAIQIENELRQSEAEAKKRVAQAEGEAKAAIARAKGDAEALRIRAEADAQTNAKIAASVTPALIEYRRVLKWDGKMPQVTSGSAITNLK